MRHFLPVGNQSQFCRLGSYNHLIQNSNYDLIYFLLAIVSVLWYLFQHKMLISFNHEVKVIHMKVKFKWQSPLMKNDWGWGSKQLTTGNVLPLTIVWSISPNGMTCSHYLIACFIAKFTSAFWAVLQHAFQISRLVVINSQHIQWDWNKS